MTSRLMYIVCWWDYDQSEEVTTWISHCHCSVQQFTCWNQQDIIYHGIGPSSRSKLKDIGENVLPHNFLCFSYWQNLPNIFSISSKEGNNPWSMWYLASHPESGSKKWCRWGGHHDVCSISNSVGSVGEECEQWSGGVLKTDCWW